MKKPGKYILNVLLCIVFSLPVVTLAAAIVAMHFVNLKLVKDREINVYREFMKSYKQNLVQSFSLLIICGIPGGFLAYSWIKQLSDFDNANMLIVGVLLIASFVFFAFESLSTYLLSKFDNKTGRLIMLTIYSMTRHCDIGVKVAILEFAVVAIPLVIVAINPIVPVIIAAAAVFFILLVLHEMVASTWVSAIIDLMIKVQNETLARQAEQEAALATENKEEIPEKEITNKEEE